MRKKVSLIVLMGAIGLLILIAGLFYTGTALGSRANDRHQAEIEHFEEELKNPQLSQEGRQLIQKKLDIVESEATQWAHGLENPGPHGDQFTPPPTHSIVGRRLPDGIDNVPLVVRPLPVYDDVSKIINAWRKTTSIHYCVVYAGCLTTDHQQGMVLVFQPETVTYHQYLTPRKSGPVRIVKEAWPYLILESESGDTFYFDPTGERFIDSLDVPTLAPTPTQTLTPVPYPYP